MLALSEYQRAFVTAILDRPSIDQWEAAQLAGYSGDRQTLRVTGHRLAHDSKVQEAMYEEAKKRMKSGSLEAVSVLLEIVRGGNGALAKDRLKAVEMLLNRVGLHALSEHKVQVEHTVDDATMIDRIRRLAIEQGLDPVKLLGSAGVIDVEFKEVPSERAVDVLEPVATGGGIMTGEVQVLEELLEAEIIEEDEG
jgi:phage terminase small subunit